MTWLVVAAKDVRDAVRSRAALVAAVALALVLAALTYGVGALARREPEFLGDGTATTADLVGAVGGQAGWLLGAVVAIVGLVLSNEAIAGERASGSIKILLGLPHARWHVVAGKLAGRATVAAAAVAVGTLVAAVVAVATYDAVAPLPLVGFGVATAALASSYVGIGVGISAAVATTRRATAGATAAFLFFVFGWDTSLLPRALLFLVEGRLLPPDGPHWFDTATLLGPGSAYGAVVDASSPLAHDAVLGIAVLTAWTVLPPALGYLRFRGADLT